MIYTDDHAERLKDRSGQRWRPANGTEAEMFLEMSCDGCDIVKIYGGPCDILDRAFMCDIDHPEYPDELQIGINGQPVCTQRLVDGVVQMGYRCSETSDLFERDKK